MANQVLLPQMGISEESAVVGEFYVHVGDAVQVGTQLFSIETGKSVFDVESEFEGVVLALLCQEGDELPIEAPVMVIGEADETFDAPQAKKAEPTREPEVKQTAEPEPAAKPEMAPDVSEPMDIDNKKTILAPCARSG